MVLKNKPQRLIQLMKVPSLYIIMGVSGSGKTTCGRALAKTLGAYFLDADDYHSTKAKQMMARGEPLNDQIRRPWIDRILTAVAQTVSPAKDCVLAFSGLKAKHRKAFYTLDIQLTFIHLELPVEVTEQRVEKRSEHFFPQNLVQSQYHALEPAQDGENILSVDATLPIPTIISNIHQSLSNSPRLGL